MSDRIYTDTSVIGGCEDDEFRVPSRRLLDAFVMSNSVTKVVDAVQVMRAARAEISATIASMSVDEQKTWLRASPPTDPTLLRLFTLAGQRRCTRRAAWVTAMWEDPILKETRAASAAP